MSLGHIYTCYVLVLGLFLQINHFFSPYYDCLSSQLLLPSTIWLLPRICLLHLICLFVWTSSNYFSSIRVPFQYHSRLIAFYTQTFFHLVMKWTAITLSFIFPRYLFIYLVVPLCWFMANWTCFIARIESKLHPEVGHRSFLVNIGKVNRTTFALMGSAAIIRHLIFK